MENYSYHVPFYVVNNGVATTGHSADLAKAQVGLFDRQNFNVATGAGTGKELFFAQGILGGKDWYGQPVTATSHKSPFFRVTDVEDMYVALPQTIQNEEWVIGYNGAAGSVGLKFAKGEAFRLKLYFHGDPIYRFFNGPKEYLISHTPQVDCTQPCDTGDCVDAAISDPIKEAKLVVDKINNHTELKKFGVKAYLTFPTAADEGTGGTNTITRTLKITLNRDADGSDRMEDFAALIGAVPGINIGTLTKIAGAGTALEGQADEYTVTQTSYEEKDAEGALSSNVTFQFAHLPAIENVAWTVVAGSETDPATVAATTPVAGRKVGIRVSAGYIDPKFGNCSFDPMDFYETQPVKMEVSLLQEDGDRCDAAQWPSVLQTKVGRIARQSGEYIVRELIMKTDAYLQHMKQYDNSPRMREAFDMKLLDQVDRNAFYKLYYVRYKASYGNSYRKNEQETFTTVFAVKEGDTVNDTAFTTNVINVLQTKTGITMHTNS